MPSTRTTSRLLTVYADKESWRNEHDEALSCLDLQEKLAWGVPLYQGLLDLEARVQMHILRNSDSEAEQLTELMPLFYQLWAESSEYYLEQARELVAKGYLVDGLDEFQETVEEARCLVDNLSMEGRIRPIEELISQARPDNPSPERYGD